MKKWMIGLGMLATSCTSSSPARLQEMFRNPETGLVQEKKIGPMVVTCTYLPRCWDGKEEAGPAGNSTGEMSFKMNIRSDNKEVLQKQGGLLAASHNLEEAFQLVVNRDTLTPLIAQRIANGNIGGVEYLVTFERPVLRESPAMALIYKDQLFTSTRLVFKMKNDFLLHSDSLSCRL